MMNGEVIARIRTYTRNFPMVDKGVQTVDDWRRRLKSKISEIRSRF